MTELERYRPPAAAVDSWTGVMPDVVNLAKYVAETEFVPKALRGKPAAVAAAILAGREIGIPPMAALRHVHMVDGTPSLSAERKRAQALAAGHKIVYVETGRTRCVVKGRRRDEEEWTTVTWTMDDAKIAGLAGRDNYRRHPRRMLEARATGELCDLIFTDATGGLATYEQLVDETDAAPAGTEGHAAPARRTARRRTKPAEPPQQSGDGSAPAPEKPAPPEPPLPGEPGYDDEPAAEPAGEAEQADAEPDTPPQPVTPKQLPKLLAMFGDAGWTDRDDRIRAASVIVGRQIGSFNDLTKDDASALIDTLELVCKDPDPQLRLTEFIERASGGEVHEGEIVEEDKP